MLALKPLTFDSFHSRKTLRAQWTVLMRRQWQFRSVRQAQLLRKQKNIQRQREGRKEERTEVGEVENENKKW